MSCALNVFSMVKFWDHRAHESHHHIHTLFIAFFSTCTTTCIITPTAMSTFPMSHPFPPPSAPSHNSHWFAQSPPSFSAATKRKRPYEPDLDNSSTSDDSSDDGLNYNQRSHVVGRPNTVASRPVKRIRTADSLDVKLQQRPPIGMENGFARMSLVNVAATTSPTGSTQQQYAPSFANQAAPRPQADATNEVRMKSRSWYEPEPDRKYLAVRSPVNDARNSLLGPPSGIVVLDLEGSDSEEEESIARQPAMQSQATDAYSVSNAYLSRLHPLHKPSTHPSAMFDTHPGSGALVLYKSPPFLPNSESATNGSFGDEQDMYEDDGPELFASIEEVDDDDDVQMMDIDD